MSKPKAQFQAQAPKKAANQTNKDRPEHRPRRYCLSPEGLRSLRETARKNKPWLQSTGPRTPGGKERSKGNATMHSERSARSRAVRRELNAALRAMRDGLENSGAPVDVESAQSLESWVERIAAELGPTWQSIIMLPQNRSIG
jgi:hypothetical protein